MSATVRRSRLSGRAGRPAPSFLRCALIAAVALAGSACSQSPEPPDLLLATIDTLRRDHVSAYGFPYARTPVMDALAAEGALFEDHYTVAGVTAPSHVTLFTGLHPRQHGVKRNGIEVPPTVVLLAEILRERGYQTAACIGAGVLGSEFGLDRGFDSFDQRFDVAAKSSAIEGAFERRAEDVVDAALAALAAADGDRPLFLWVHLFDPHLPHARPFEEWPLVDELVAEGCVLAPPNDFQDQQHVARLRRGYAAEVRHADRELGRLLAAWDARTAQLSPERTAAVVVTSDHGEGLGEHSYIGHSFYLYAEQMRVPLVVRMPARIPAGSRATSLTSSVDVGATLLDLLGIDPPRGFGGASLLPLLGAARDAAATAFAERPPLADAMVRLRRGEEQPADPKTLQNRLVQARSGSAGSGELGLVAAVRADWKYVWSEDAPDELYDLGSDPRELADLGEEHARARELSALVERWRVEVGALHEPARDEPGAGARDMLDALGY